MLREIAWIDRREEHEPDDDQQGLQVVVLLDRRDAASMPMATSSGIDRRAAFSISDGDHQQLERAR